MASLAVVILTYNEEIHLERALRNIGSLASQVFVVDSYSTDRTLEIARAHGAVVLQHPFSSQAQQFQWALENAPITADWVMRLDADEVIERGLVDEIERELPRLPPEVTGVNLKRRHVFLGRWIRHGGRYPVVLLRIWRRGTARIEQRWMDEHILLITGRAVTFAADFSDVNLNDLGFFTAKHNSYATREAIDVILQRRGISRGDSSLTYRNASRKATTSRLIKEKIYNKIPFELSAAAYFILRYVLQLGFLDGREGAIYHFLQGYWYRFLVGAKVLEFERGLQNLSAGAAVATLSQMTGLDIAAALERAG